MTPCHIWMIETFMHLIQNPLSPPVFPQPLDHMCKIKHTDKNLPLCVASSCTSCSTPYLTAFKLFPWAFPDIILK